MIWTIPLVTRSQAVARRADRTAKKLYGSRDLNHTPTFREIICAPARHSQYKAAYQIKSLAQVALEICSIVCQKL